MTELVCLDTNAWYAESLLRSSVGSAVLYLVSRTDRRLLLPEVVDRELESLVLREIKIGLSKAEDLQRRVLEMLGDGLMHGMSRAVNEDEVRREFHGRMRGLAAIMQPLPATDGARARAFDRVIEGRIPNSPKNQQAKDSLLWEQLMDLPRDTSAVLVSADRMFCEGNDPTKGLAIELLDDAKNRGLTVRLVSDCADLLATSEQVAPPVDEQAVAHALGEVIMAMAKQAIKRIDSLSERPFDDPSFRFSLFLTETPHEFAVSIRASVPFVVQEDSDLEYFTFAAQAMFNSETRAVTQTEITSVSTPVTPSGGFGMHFGSNFRRGAKEPAFRVPVDRINAGLPSHLKVSPPQKREPVAIALASPMPAEPGRDDAND